MKRLIPILFLLSCGASAPALRLALEAPRSGFIPPISIYKEIGKVTPKNLVLADRRFPQSLYLNPLPILDDTKGLAKRSTTKILSPNMYRNFDEAGINNKKYLTYLLTPGDYSHWGPLAPRRSGKNIVVRAYDVNNVPPYDLIHPCKQENKVILAGFRMENISGWTLHSLTFKKAGNNRLYECQNINLDYCYFEDSNFYGIRIVNSSYCFVQCCVFIQKNLTRNRDGGGIAISATRGRVSRNNRIINNTIYNFNDALGTPREGSQDMGASSMTGTVDGLVIEGNDLYVDSLTYYYKDGFEYSICENGQDFKTGTRSLRPEDKIKVIGNRMHGFRRSNSSNGCAVVVHRNSANIEFSDNIVWNCTIAFNVSARDRKFPFETIENISFKNNLMFDLNKASGFPYEGSGFLIATGIEASNNTVIGLKPYFIGNDKVTNLFNCNLFADSEQLTEFTFYYDRWNPKQVTVNAIGNYYCRDGWN